MEKLKRLDIDRHKQRASSINTSARRRVDALTVYECWQLIKGRI
jgi:hypothetical protein